MVEKIKNINWSYISKYKSVLMGFSALLIVVFHSQVMIYIPGILSFIREIFNIGVDVFIFLSGIGLYFSFSKKPKFKDYYIKRLLNVYVITIIIYLPYLIFMNGIDWNFKSAVIFLCNWLFPNYLTGHPDVWYIIFILFMYMLYPVIYKVLFESKAAKHSLLMVTLFSVIWIAMCYAFEYFNFSFYKEIGMEREFTRVPIFIIGSYLGKYVYEKRKINKLDTIAIISGVILFLVFTYFLSDFKTTYRITHTFLCLPLVFFVILLFEVLPLNHIRKFCEFVGSFSLELYLTHVFMYNVFLKLELKSWYWYLIAVIIAFIISIPLSKLRSTIVRKYTDYKKIKLD